MKHVYITNDVYFYISWCVKMSFNKITNETFPDYILDFSLSISSVEHSLIMSSLYATDYSFKTKLVFKIKTLHFFIEI